MPEGGFHTKQPIALVGLMGAGKSTIGRRLAERLGLPFVDSDLEVERLEGRSVFETFERFGEPYFRERERSVINHLLDLPPRVIATGGGAFAEEATHRALLTRSLTVWLDAPVRVLGERIAGSGERPLLWNRAPETVLEALSRERAPWFARSELRVETGDSTTEQVVDLILAGLVDLRR